jgi:hypothetical protein
MRTGYVSVRRKFFLLLFLQNHLTIYNSDSYLRFLNKGKQKLEKDNVNDHLCTFWAT